MFELAFPKYIFSKFLFHIFIDTKMILTPQGFKLAFVALISFVSEFQVMTSRAKPITIPVAAQIMSIESKRFRNLSLTNSDERIDSVELIMCTFTTRKMLPKITSRTIDKVKRHSLIWVWLKDTIGLRLSMARQCLCFDHQWQTCK